MITLVKERGHGTLPKYDGTFVAWNNERWECFHVSNDGRSASFAYNDYLRTAIQRARSASAHREREAGRSGRRA